ncbi:hypothetical protein HNQ56_002568 [Anaerotaenia torta]|uniref:hypothetical protein n=1 Tax=Anaerotaenia torta TaxID=433293 RepID=UPI003D1DCE01
MLKHKYILAGFLKTAVLMAAVCSVLVTAACQANRKGIQAENGYNKNLSRIAEYGPMDLKSYRFVDYKGMALDFDRLVFDYDAVGEYLPLIWEDKTYESFGLPAYVGDDRRFKDGAQEAVTCIAAVLSASLNGIDKSNSQGHNYVRMLNAFYNEEEKVILNNPSGSSAATSMWYLLYPAILYVQTSSLYPNEKQMAENAANTVNSWYEAYEIMYGDGSDPDFDYTGFDFMKKEPYHNNIWSEPDCAVGIAWLMDYAYDLTGEDKYFTAMKNCLDYIEEYFGGPLYEVLQYFGPFLSAKTNALHGTNYDMNQAFGRVFDGSSIPRGGWGSIRGTWGDYDISGLFGSVTDRGGYAFAMNSFAATSAVIPAAKYDTRYARAIGDWILRVTQNARYFFADETKQENQSTGYLDNKSTIPELIKSTIPYEGIIHSYNGKTPWFGGDPTINGWAETDFSLYSGAHIGILASRISRTDQEGILKIDLSEHPMKEELKFYLLYNPYSEYKKVTYEVTSEAPVDLYNTVINEYLVKAVTKEASISIPAKEAAVIVEIPAGTQLRNENGTVYAGKEFIAAGLCSVAIENLKQNQSVSGKFDFEIKLYSNQADEITEAILSIAGEEISFQDKITINTKDYGSGNKNLQVRIRTKNGQTDTAMIRLYFE